MNLRKTITGLVGLSFVLSSFAISAGSANADSTIVHRNPSSKLDSQICDADVAILGLRGSGQDQTNVYRKDHRFLNYWIDGYGKEDPYMVFQGMAAQSSGLDARDQIEGFGNEVATAAFEIRNSFPDSLKVGYVPITFDAVPPEYGVAKPKLYTKSFQMGADNLRFAVNHIVRNCLDTQIAIIGYSQGAQATHAALSDIPLRDRERIASVVMIADPVRQLDDKVAKNTGGIKITDKSTSMYNGVFARGGADRIPDAADLPADMAGRILSVCFDIDAICNYNPNLADKYALVADAIGLFRFHGSVYQDTNFSGLYKIPGEWSRDRISERLIKQQKDVAGNVYADLSKTIKCPDYNLVVAQGENQDGAPAQTSGSMLGFTFNADFAASYLYALKTEMPGKSIGIKRAQYTNATKDDAEYKASTDAGVAATQRAVEGSIKECSNSKIILFGHEQGAEVIHKVAKGYESNDKVKSKISAIWRVADPMRSGDDSAVTEFYGDPESLANMSTFSDGEILKSGGILKSEDRSLNYNIPIASVCHAGDTMCNPQKDTKIEDASYWVDYLTYTSFYDESSKWIAKGIK